MIRRPRYPLTLRLAWMESELASAATLANAMTRDMLMVRLALEEAESRLVVLAGVVGAVLVPMGVDPKLVDALVTEMSPEGDPLEAEEVGAAILQQVVLLTGRMQGEGD